MKHALNLASPARCTWREVVGFVAVALSCLALAAAIVLLGDLSTLPLP